MLQYSMWGVQKTHNLIKEYTYRVRTLIWPFYFNLDHCGLNISCIFQTIHTLDFCTDLASPKFCKKLQQYDFFQYKTKYKQVLQRSRNLHQSLIFQLDTHQPLVKAQQFLLHHSFEDIRQSKQKTATLNFLLAPLSHIGKVIM